MQYVGRIRNIGKPFGYIRRDGHEDEFVHKNECPSNAIPPSGTIVEFTLGKYNGKVVARDVVIVALPEAVSDVEA
jgi:cold shock CspA family protein